jgi:hypothetical protein
VSREVAGDAPEELAPVVPEVIVPAPTVSPEATGHPVDDTDPDQPDEETGPTEPLNDGPDAAAPRGRRLAAAWIAALFLTAVLAGWSGEAAWQGTASPSIGVNAAATVLEARPSPTELIFPSADLWVRITNLGDGPLSFGGAQTSFDAGSIERISPARFTMPAGGEAIVAVHAIVACGSPQPLRLPPLSVRGADLVRHSVPIDGGAAALARVCSGERPALHLLQLVRASQDAERLRLVIHSPSGRTTILRAVSAGGVPLGGIGSPVVIEGYDRSVWLDPPAACAPSWSVGGLPRSLDLDVDAGGPSRISLATGAVLSSWLLAHACTAESS